MTKRLFNNCPTKRYTLAIFPLWSIACVWTHTQHCVSLLWDNADVERVSLERVHTFSTLTSVWIWFECSFAYLFIAFAYFPFATLHPQNGRLTQRWEMSLPHFMFSGGETLDSNRKRFMHKLLTISGPQHLTYVSVLMCYLGSVCWDDMW